MKKNLIIIIIVSLAVGFWGGIEFQRQKTEIPLTINDVYNKEALKPASIDFSLFWEAWNKIGEKYVDKNKLDPQKMIFGAIEGMVSSLGDPYTVFLPPQEAKKFQEDIRGSFSGVGIEIGIRNEILTVIAPLKDTPAEKAGIQAGDKILKIDEESTAGIKIDEAVSKIRGPRGTKVTLNISRAGFDQPKDFTITRDIIKVKAVTLEKLDPLKTSGQRIAHLQLHAFNQNAASEFEKAVKEIQKEEIDRIILDLRNNPGGLLDLAVEISSWFMESNQVVVSEVFADGHKDELRSKDIGDLKNHKLVVLINNGSASASEIVAGALHDNKGIKLIGEKTFGKGSVQQIEELKNKSSLKITIAKWLTPSGRSITDLGIEPDIEIKLTDEDKDAGRDPQLEKAIEVVKSL